MKTQRGNLAHVEALIAWHADVDAADINGWTALILASRSGHVEVVRALLAAGVYKHLSLTFLGHTVTAYSIANQNPASTASISGLPQAAPSIDTSQSGGV